MTISDALGTPDTIEFRGKTYSFGLLTESVKAGFETWLRDGARAALLELKDLYTPGEWQEAMALHASRVARRYFAWGSSAWAGAMQTEEGLTCLCRLLLGCSEKEFFDMLCAKPDEVSLLLRGVLARSLPAEALARIEEQKGDDSPKA